MTQIRVAATAFLLAAWFSPASLAQQATTPTPQTPGAAPAKPAQPAPKAAAKPVQPAPKAAPQTAKPAQPKPAAPAAAATAATGGVQPTLLGQYGDWGAYTAAPGGSKICFVLGKPKTSKTEPPDRPRDPSYMFVSTRPAENVRNEVSVTIGYPFKTPSDATAEIGTAKFGMYTQNDGAWIKNIEEEARMVDAMRKGADLTVKGTSGRGTQSIDQFSLKGLAQALDKIEQACK